MLVVISIIGILSAVLAGGYVNSQKNSKDAARKLNLKAISDALNLYYADYGKYPLMTGATGINNLIENQGEFAAGGNIYMKKMPKDDITGGRSGIRYEVSSSLKSFRLYINLENEEDKSCYKTPLGGIENNLNGYTINSGCIYLLTSSNTGATGTSP